MPLRNPRLARRVITTVVLTTKGTTAISVSTYCSNSSKSGTEFKWQRLNKPHTHTANTGIITWEVNIRRTNSARRYKECSANELIHRKCDEELMTGAV